MILIIVIISGLAVVAWSLKGTQTLDNRIRLAVHLGLQEFAESSKLGYEKRRQDMQVVNATPDPPAPPTKDPDLRGEFLEILFRPRSGPFTSRQIYILCQLRITNHGSRQTVVNRWEMAVSINGQVVGNGEQISLPSDWSIRRGERNEQLLGDIGSLSGPPYESGISRAGYYLISLVGSLVIVKQEIHSHRTTHRFR